MIGLALLPESSWWRLNSIGALFTSVRGSERLGRLPASGESGANLTFDGNLVARRLYVLAPIVGAIIVTIVLTHERSTAAAAPAE